jgi:DNA-binding NarL/FixJ family response regulator
MEQPFYETTRRPHQRLSPRELEVLVLVGRGASNPAIAAALHLGMGTVKQHLERAFAKLRVSDRSAAVLRAVQLGWIDAEALQLDAV